MEKRSTATALTVLPRGGAPDASGVLLSRPDLWRIRRANDRIATEHERAGLKQATSEALVALEEAAAAVAVAAERALSVAESLDEALTILADTEALAISAPASPASRTIATLSPREREVLALVARGYSNKAIAAALYVSPNTVKTHVASLLQKLDAASRVQLAATATRLGLGDDGARRMAPLASL